MTYMATPKPNKPCLGGHDNQNFCRQFLGHHYYILNLSDTQEEVKKYCIFTI